MRILSLRQDDKTSEVYLTIDFEDGNAPHDQRFSDLSTMKAYAFESTPATREEAIRKVCKLIVDGTITFEDVAAKEGLEVEYIEAEVMEKQK
jgi:hypothetical protein